MKTISEDQAQDDWFDLLDDVAKGGQFTITRHGVPVAVLVPASASDKPDDKPDIEQAIQTIRESRKGQRLDGLSIREMIEEGRP